MNTKYLLPLGVCAFGLLACEDSSKKAQEKADQMRTTAGEVARQGQQQVDQKTTEANEGIRKAFDEATEAQRKADEIRVKSEYKTKIDARLVELDRDVTSLKREVNMKTGDAKKATQEVLVATERKIANLKQDASDFSGPTKESWTGMKARVDEDLK